MDQTLSHHLIHADFRKEILFIQGLFAFNKKDLYEYVNSPTPTLPLSPQNLLYLAFFRDIYFGNYEYGNTSSS